MKYEAAITNMLESSYSTIPYRRELNEITGGMRETLLLQQMFYWWNISQKPFFKFLAPCDHKDYKEGDSWCEELDISAYMFRKAFKKLESLGLVSKKANSDRVTYYTLNLKKLFSLLKKLFQEKKKSKPKPKQENTGNPTLEEVQQEAKEKGYPEYFAKKFHKYFTEHGWDKVKDWKLRMDKWFLDEKKLKPKEKKEAKITKPKNHYEMQLFLKQLSDAKRERIRFKDKSGTLMSVSQFGCIIDSYSKELCDDKYQEKVFDTWIKDFRKFKRTYRL